LQTLPEEEFVSGMAEVAKYGFALKPDLLEQIQKDWNAIASREPGVTSHLVKTCAQAKAGVVSSDERDDKGSRIVLNYGHTLGHALEALDGYEGLRHGEAISIGMVFAAALAGEMGLLHEDGVELHSTLLEQIGLPTSGEFDAAEVIHRVQIDKKNEGSARWVLLEDVGKAVVVDDIADEVVLKTLERVLRT
jgi:3-dehydroquinate synthase